MLIDTTFTLECPKCGRKSLVKRQEDLYQCLACDFKKDLTKSESESSGASLLAIFVLAIVLIFVISQERATVSCAPNDRQCLQQLPR